MRKAKARITRTILILVVMSGILTAQTLTFESDKNREAKIWGNYFISGTFGVSYLFDDIRGDKNLFLSQFNLTQGINIPEISLRAHRIPENPGGIDLISVDVTGFGAEPFGRAQFRLEKRRSFYLSGGYTERKYFADVASFANPLFNPDAADVPYRSFHTRDTKEKIYDLGGRIQAASWLGFNAYWQRLDLDGDSLITLHLLNNEFSLSEPVNQTSNLFRLGSDVNINNYLYYKITGVYQTFNLNQTTSSEGENVGIRGLPSESAGIYLTDQSRVTTVDLETWTLDQSLQIFPVDTLAIGASYRKSSTEGTSTGDESMEGRFVWPFLDLISSATLLNSGDIKKDFDRADAKIDLQLIPELRIRAGYDYYKYKIENSDSLDITLTRSYYNRIESESASFNPLIQMKYHRFYGEADLQLGRNLFVRGGYAHSKNNFDLRRGGEQEDHSYKLNSYYGSLSYKFSNMFSMKATLKRGDYDKVFARAIPLEATQAGIEAGGSIAKNWNCSLYYKHHNLENDAFNYTSKRHSYGGHILYHSTDGNRGARIHFSKNDMESVIDIIRFVSATPEAVEDVSEYLSDMIHASGSLWYRKGIISLNAGYSYTKTEGTFPVKIEFPYAKLALKVVTDFAITFDYRYYKHSQKIFASQNYEAHLFNFGFLYTF